MVWRKLVSSMAMIAVVVTAGAPARGEEGPTTKRARAALRFELPPLRKPNEARWTGEWFAALEEATRRNVPVVAVLSDDVSAGFNTMKEAVYSTEEFARFTHRVVLLAAFDGKQHPAKPRVVDGREIAWCDLFDCPCDDHRAAFVRVRNDFAQREYWNPLHVFVSPAGKELTRAEGHVLTIDRLKEELAVASKALPGPSLTYVNYRDLLVRLRGLVDLREKKGHQWVDAELGKLLEAEQKAITNAPQQRVLVTAAMVAFVESLRSALLEEGDGLIEDASELIASGDVAGARKLLASVMRSFKGLPPSKAAELAFAKLPASEPKKKG